MLNEGKYITYRELARRASCPVETVYTAVEEQLLSPVRVNKEPFIRLNGLTYAFISDKGVLEKTRRRRKKYTGRIGMKLRQRNCITVNLVNDGNVDRYFAYQPDGNAYIFATFKEALDYCDSITSFVKKSPRGKKGNATSVAFTDYEFELLLGCIPESTMYYRIKQKTLKAYDRCLKAGKTKRSS